MSQTEAIVRKKVGWTVKNILSGLAFLFVGFIIWFLDSVVVGVETGVTGKKFVLGFWGEFGFALMAFAVLGFWIAIPACQKWWTTKRWLALAFLIPTIVLGLLVLISIRGK